MRLVDLDDALGKVISVVSPKDFHVLETGPLLSCNQRGCFKVNHNSASGFTAAASKEMAPTSNGIFVLFHGHYKGVNDRAPPSGMTRSGEENLKREGALSALLGKQ